MTSPADSTNSKPETSGDQKEKPTSSGRGLRIILLLTFCLAQFLDVFNFAAMFVAIPAIQSAFKISTADAIWIVSAFQLTFASFLLLSGRISDMYDPKLCFIGGILVLGLTSLGCGFVHTQIPLFVLRALGGIGASLTIPSAFGLIIRFFPEPNEQAIAIGAFGGSGAVGNDVLWFRNLFFELGYPQHSATTLFCDDRGTVMCTHDPHGHTQMKHIDIHAHFIQDCVNNKIIDVIHIPNYSNIEDLFTKPLACMLHG